MMSRFMEKVQVPTDPNNCWIWQGAVANRGYPYGIFYANNKALKAHRVSFEIFNCRPPEKFVLHKCDNPRCVNPAHLFEGTQTDNMRDCAAKGRNVQQKKTHCSKGHPLVQKKLQRICPECKRVEALVRFYRKKNEHKSN